MNFARERERINEDSARRLDESSRRERELYFQTCPFAPVVPGAVSSFLHGQVQQAWTRITIGVETYHGSIDGTTCLSGRAAAMMDECGSAWFADECWPRSVASAPSIVGPLAACARSAKSDVVSITTSTYSRRSRRRRQGAAHRAGSSFLGGCARERVSVLSGALRASMAGPRPMTRWLKSLARHCRFLHLARLREHH